MSTKLPRLPDDLDVAKIESLNSASLPNAKEIEVSFFSHQLRKSTKLIGNTDESHFIKARREWLDFDFLQLIYVTSVIVYAEGYENYHEFELSYQDIISGNTKSLMAKFDGQTFTFRPNALVGGFGIQPTTRFWKESKITRIEVRGVEQASFSDVVNVMRSINQETEKIIANLNRYFITAKEAEVKSEKLNSELVQVEESIRVKQQESIDVSEEIHKLISTKDDLEKKIEVARSVQKATQQEEGNLKDRIARLNSEISSATSDISAKKSELGKLQDDINMFPAEISGYVAQGATNVRLYSVLCAVPIVVICIITYRLFMNAEGILDYNPQIWKNVLEFLISRVPYVLVSFAILAVCYTVINRLVSEIIGINRRRQDLYKVSIIASDVAYASQNGMDLDPVELFNLRTEAKMELLKEHLKQHISEDYSYNPKKNFFHKITSKISSHVAEVKEEQEDNSKKK